MDKISMTCCCGASITIESRYTANLMMADWQKDHLNCPNLLVEKLLTTVEPTQIAPIQGGPLAAEIDRIFPRTQPSSQSDPVDTKSGPVEHNSGCVHPYKMFLAMVNPAWKPWWCPKCGALMLTDKILVPDAVLTSSTSVKQPSNEFVENSVEESARSPSRRWNNMCRVSVLQDSHCVIQDGHSGPHKNSMGNTKEK